MVPVLAFSLVLAGVARAAYLARRGRAVVTWWSPLHRFRQVRAAVHRFSPSRCSQLVALVLLLFDAALFVEALARDRLAYYALAEAFLVLGQVQSRLGCTSMMHAGGGAVGAAPGARAGRVGAVPADRVLADADGRRRDSPAHRRQQNGGADCARCNTPITHCRKALAATWTWRRCPCISCARCRCWCCRVWPRRRHPPRTAIQGSCA